MLKQASVPEVFRLLLPIIVRYPKEDYYVATASAVFILTDGSPLESL